MAGLQQLSHQWVLDLLLRGDCKKLLLHAHIGPHAAAHPSNPFIACTSNTFAILGLRALYFALAAMIHRFKYLKYALAMVLVFIGTKIYGWASLARFRP